MNTKTTQNLTDIESDNFIDFKTPKRFINRELSWLQFNLRVLNEAMNTTNPLMERIRFLSISSSNLDEFFMVRVAGLKAQLNRGIISESPDNMTPAEQLQAIEKEISQLNELTNECVNILTKDLEKESIFIVSPEKLKQKEKTWLLSTFQEKIFPVLSPLSVDPAHPFPFIPNLGHGMIMDLSSENSGESMIAVVILPLQLPRYIRLPGDPTRFIHLSSVIKMFYSHLFPGYNLTGSGSFQILRDSELEIDEEAEDLVRTFQSALNRRRRGNAIRLRVSEGIPQELKKFITQQFHISSKDVVQDPHVGLSYIKELISDPRPNLIYPKYTARFPERIRDFEGDCFKAISTKDIVVHHPYESFDVVIQFIRQASRDKQVVSIKQTLYRTSEASPIVQALVEAAESGKNVTAMVELKARFDEEANIKLARKLERSGVQVVYGIIDLKTHAKLSLVVRREGKNLISYAHLGTGNYHPITAQIYTDLSFFTCNTEICSDVMKIFNYMTGYAKPKNLKFLEISPLSLRQRIIENINQEIQFANQGKPSQIWAKMNSLVDPQVIDALYQASQSGVQIDLVIRGICCLRPGINGFSENIRVKSIIGRFLEHSRICCFSNGQELPSPNAKVYFSSADWMPRNLDRRIETLIPILNPTVHQQILGQIMVANLQDTEQSWLLNPDGSYTKYPSQQNSFNAHKFFMTNPSLSGRGSALRPELLKTRQKLFHKRGRKKPKG